MTLMEAMFMRHHKRYNISILIIALQWLTSFAGVLLCVFVHQVGQDGAAGEVKLFGGLCNVIVVKTEMKDRRCKKGPHHFS